MTTKTTTLRARVAELDAKVKELKDELRATEVKIIDHKHATTTKFDRMTRAVKAYTNEIDTVVKSLTKRTVDWERKLHRLEARFPDPVVLPTNPDPHAHNLAGRVMR